MIEHDHALIGSNMRGFGDIMNNNTNTNTNNTIAPSTVAPESVESKRLLNATKVTDSKKLLIEVDTSKLTFENLKAVAPSDKGNRTVLYEKWSDGGITYQLTGYVTTTNFDSLENVQKTIDMKKQALENQELKEQLAQFQMMMNHPEFKQLMYKFTGKK
jgi:hypothetical protein